VTSADHGRDGIIAYAILRLTMGINMALHGLTRIADGTGAYAAGLTTQFSDTILPAFSVTAFGYVLPWAEAVIGLLLMAGLATRAALIAGGLLMSVLTFGTVLRQEFATAGLQLTYSLAYFFLLTYCSRNGFSLDAMSARGQQRA
jgi:thiosulfate dehydrogenase [quinone] large subunit